MDFRTKMFYVQMLCACFFVCLLEARIEGAKFKPIRIGSNSIQDDNQPIENKNVLIAIHVSNHEYSLPTFLATLEKLKCANKCDLLFQFDKCTDQSVNIIEEWKKNLPESKFNSVESRTYDKSENLRHKAMQYALENNFDFVFLLKADVILLNENTINILIQKRKSIVAPMLTSTDKNGYSNFRMKQEDSIEFKKIYDREVVGCFAVSTLRDCFLVNLNDDRLVDFLARENESPIELDELDWLNNLSIESKIVLQVCNRVEFGYLPELLGKDESSHAAFVHLRIEHLLKGANKTYNQELPKTALITQSIKSRSKIGFDEIYVINLERRTDRRERIESTLNDLDLSYKMFNAIDGKKLNDEYIRNLGIRLIPDYKDPYRDRSINYGEIGCFLSHYFIWQEMLENKIGQAIILEDDARFKLNFKHILESLMMQMNQAEIEWDLIYLGRKIMRYEEETWVSDIAYKNLYGLKLPAYSHWTIAYALSLSGARKLIEAKPLEKIVPVDEYLPIMFDRQPNEYWTSFFPRRDLIAFAVQPSLIEPTHFSNEPSYVSDTEYTPILNVTNFEFISTKQDEPDNSVNDLKQSSFKDEL